MEETKIICLMPVKNEAAILPTTLGIISEYADVIIIADQMSDDGSREVYKNFPKVRVIDNNRTGHSNEVRWDLLRAAREHGKNNLIICLDADEYIPSNIFKNFLSMAKLEVGQSFRFPWIQLWKSKYEYNDTGVWYRNYQRAAWVDDGETEYKNKFVINDHTSRVPERFLNNCIRVDNVPIMHLQWVFWEKTQMKQAWYRCSELVKSPESWKIINDSYSHSLEVSKKLKNTPKEWLEDLEEKDLVQKQSDWHKNEIIKMFEQYGVTFFEKLQIWHVPELEAEFIKRTNRKPEYNKNKTLSKRIQNIKRSIIKTIRY